MRNLKKAFLKGGDILFGGLQAILILFITPNLLVHELGHFAATLLMGVHVDAVEIGEGDVLCRFSLRKIPVTIREIPVGGGVLINSNKEHARWQIVIVLMAGSLANLTVAVVCILTDHLLGWVYGIINLIVCGLSLWPGRGSDGHLSYMLLRGKVPEGMVAQKKED